MGTEISSYQDLQLEEELPLPGEKGWRIHDARTKDGARVSVFLHNKSTAHPDLLQNAAKQLKTLRHPYILKFLALTKSSSGHKLVTESVIPLEMVVESLTAAEVASGLYNILEALIFLHDRVGMCHNNICMSSVYVGEDGSWRLGGMEYVCSFKDASLEYLSQFKSMREEASLAPEEKSGKLDVSPDRHHCRDAYAFGVLAEQLLESMADLGDMTKTFELRIQDELLHPDPKNRPKLHTLLNDRLFSNGFLEVTHFLQHITLKSEVEKKDFFSLLIDKLHEMPAELVGSRLTRLLLSRFVLLDPTAVTCIVPHLLTPYQGKDKEASTVEENVRPLFSTGEFVKYVIPELFKIFHVRDAHIRLVLLSRFPYYARLFNKTNLQNVILPQLLLGLRDLNDDLVEASLRCLAELVPILGGDLVIGSHRGKIFSEGKPKFDAHGTNGIKIKDVGQRIESPVQSQRSMGKNKSKEAKTLKEIAKEHDREQRRAEIAQRNEERKKKREERAKLLEAKTKERNEENINRSLGTTNQEVETSVIGDEREMCQFSTEGPSDHWSHWDQDEREEHVHINYSKEHFESEEIDYDQEIEDELQAMDSPRKKGPLTEYSEPGPPVAVDWSDAAVGELAEVKFGSKTRGMLKLKSKSKLSPPPKAKSPTSIENEWGEDDWGFQEETNHVTVTPRKSASPKVKSSRSRQGHGNAPVQQDGWIDDWCNNDSFDETSPIISPSHNQNIDQGRKSEKKAVRKPEEELGAEFDILSIKVKPKVEKESDPFDFFSDMEPVIPMKNPLADLLDRSYSKDGELISPDEHLGSGTNTHASRNEEKKREAKDISQSKLSFAVMDTTEGEVEVGWGDDDWEDPDALLEEGIDT